MPAPHRSEITDLPTGKAGLILRLLMSLGY